MNDKEKELMAFANELHHTAELVEASLIRKRGQKSTSKRARVLLIGIKKQITGIKRMLMEVAEA